MLIFSTEITSEVRSVSSQRDYDRVTVMWEKPFINPYCATKYKIKYSNKVAETERQSINLDLSTNQSVSIDIESLNRNGQGQEMTYILHGSEYRGVHSIKHELLNDSGSIKLSWSPAPDYKPPVGYEVKVKLDKELIIETTDTFTRFQVSMCQHNSVEVTAVYEKDKRYTSEYQFLPMGGKIELFVYFILLTKPNLFSI